MAIWHCMCLVLWALRVSAAWTWWADPQCADLFGETGIDDMLQEAVDIATMMRQRLQRSKADEFDAHNSFSALFRYELHQPRDEIEAQLAARFKAVIGGFPDTPGDNLGLTSWIKQTIPGDAGRRSSNLRIRCDNGEGFVLLPDDPQAPVPNSQRPPDEQEWIARDEMVKTKGKPTCTTDKGDATMFVASSWVNAEGHIAPRARLSICDTYIIQGASRKDLWESLGSDERLGPVNGRNRMTTLADIGSLTMLHELTHAHPIYARDHAYGWDQAVALDRYKATETAESYSLMGAAIRALDDKYYVDDEDLGSGELVYDPDLPARVTS